MLHDPEVRDHVADHDVRISPALTPLLDAELADDHRAAVESAAGSFDPAGLYGIEVERDEAVNDLIANLPADVSIRLAQHRITQRIAGEWETFDGWTATATTADFALSEQGDRPLAAVEKLLNAWRRRPRPATSLSAA